MNLEHYKKIHNVNFKFGILAAILIIGIFGTFYCGFTKITYGYVPGNQYNDYILYPQSMDLNNDSNIDIIGYSDRIHYVSDQFSNNYGTTNNNSIIIFNSKDGNLEWQYVLNKTNFVINKFSLLNYEEAAYEKKQPIFFIQYSQVSGEENLINNYSDSNEVQYARNETGHYETYLIKGLEENPIIANLTSIIKDRVTNVFLLKYNSEDDEPDFLVQSVNTTYQDKDLYSSNDIVGLYSFYANGTLAWNINSTNPNDNGLEEDQYNTNAQIDSDHYAMIQNHSDLSVVDLRTGLDIWNSSLFYNISFQNVFATYRDYNLDGHLDICAQYFNSSDNCYYLGFLDGSNGHFLSNPGTFKTNFTWSIDLYETLTLSANDPHYILTFDEPFTGCSIYKIVNNGLELIRTINNSFLKQGYTSMGSNQNFAIDHNLYYSIEGTKNNENVTKLYLIDLSSGNFIASVHSMSNSYIINDFNSKYPGPECALIDYTDKGYYYENMMQSIPFFEASWIDTILFIIFIACIAISTSFLIKNRRTISSLMMIKKDDNIENPNEISNRDSEKEKNKSLKQISKIALVCLSVLLAGMVGFVIFSIYSTSENLNILGSDDFLALRNVYIIITLLLASLTLISILYNHMSSFSAIFYIKIQKFFYKLLKKNVDYRIVVLDMEYGKKYSPIVILERSIFAILISLTIGLAVFQTFSTQTIGTVTGNINLKFISQFELYGGLSFIATYIVILFIIPGAWLLDDCGIVYFNEPVETIAPGDISKISSWLLSWLKGLFGFTALLNYYNLFKNFNFFAVANQESPIVGIILLIFVFGILLILSPILYGVIAMLYSNTSMIGDLEYNKQKLFGKMESMGISTKSYKLRDFFEHKTQDEFSGPNTEQINETEDITKR